MDKAVATYLAKLKKYDQLPYYAVVFEQPIGGRSSSAAIVSQSPSMIRQWLETVRRRTAAPRLGCLPPSDTDPRPLAAEQSMQNH